MAKKLSREQRRKLKEKQQRIVKQSKGINTKQIQQLSNKELKELANSIVTEKQVREKKKQANKKRYQKQLADTNWKFQELVSMGFKPESLTTTNLRKVKKKDIKEGKINKKNYPFLYPELKVDKKLLKFDYNKVYKFPDGHGLYIAFRDFMGEKDLYNLLARYGRLSNKELLLKLQGLINQEETYNKEEYKKSKGRRGTSSGSAGDYQMVIADIDTIESFDNTVMGEDYASIFFPKRQHTNSNARWQKLTDKDGNVYISEFTTHKLLTLTVAIMDNITEDIRSSFYTRMYSDITYYFPELAEVLPRG
jgi:hypothetical protein